MALLQITIISVQKDGNVCIYVCVSEASYGAVGKDGNVCVDEAYGAL